MRTAREILRTNALLCILGLVLFALTSMSAHAQGSGETIVVTIGHAPESNNYLGGDEGLINLFNEVYLRGKDPLQCGSRQNLINFDCPFLPPDAPRIQVVGKSEASGSIANDIIDRILNRNQSAYCPTIFQPSVRHWLEIVNTRTGQSIFDLQSARDTAVTWVVIAMWESRLSAYQTHIGAAISWDALLNLVVNPNQNFLLALGRQEVLFGQTNPSISSTALSALTAEYYAVARSLGLLNPAGSIDASIVDDPNVRTRIDSFQNAIKRNAGTTAEWQNFIQQGPNYVDVVVLEEDTVFRINSNIASPPPERLIALYPTDGSFQHTHPMAITNGCSSESEIAAGNIFVDYILQQSQQEYIVQHGFRPVVNTGNVGQYFNDVNGLTDVVPISTLPIPSGDVMLTIQQRWVQPQPVDYMLVVDISGSMSTDLPNMKNALNVFVSGLPDGSRVGLIAFADNPNEVELPLEFLSNPGVREQILQTIQSLEVRNETAIYGAIQLGIQRLEASQRNGRQSRLILFSDGASRGEPSGIENLVLPEVSRVSSLAIPIEIVPLFYLTGEARKEGSRADVDLIAQNSGTTVITADRDSIRETLVALLNGLSQ
jgi:hypothetical protein